MLTKISSVLNAVLTKRTALLPVTAAAALGLCSCTTIGYMFSTFGMDMEVRGYAQGPDPVKLSDDRGLDANPYELDLKIEESASSKTFVWERRFFIYPSAAYFNMARNINALLRETCSAHGGDYRPSGPWDKSASEHVCVLKNSDSVLFDWGHGITDSDGEFLTYTTTLHIAHKDQLSNPEWLEYSTTEFVPPSELGNAIAAYEAEGIKTREAVRAVYDQRMRPEGLSDHEKRSLSLYERQWFSYIMLSERARGMQVCSLINRDTLTYRLGYIVNSAAERIQVYVDGAGRPLEGYNLAEFSPYYSWERPEKWQGDCPSLHRVNQGQSVEGMVPVMKPQVSAAAQAQDAASQVQDAGAGMQITQAEQAQ